MRVGLSYHEGKPEYELYAEVLARAGVRYGIPVEPVWLCGIGKRFDHRSLDGLSGVVLTGGADVAPDRYGFADPEHLCRVVPERDEAEFPLVEAVLERRLPVLAICRGMQLLNVVCGGTLVLDLPGHDSGDDSKRHTAALSAGSFLADFVGQTAGEVSSTHHQAVERPGAGLQIVAMSPDGIVEAIEWLEPAKKPWLVAVQWHPERMSLDEPLSGTLYREFLRSMV